MINTKYQAGNLIKLIRDVVVYREVEPYPNPDDAWVLAKGQFVAITNIDTKYYPGVCRYEMFSFMGPGKCFGHISEVEMRSVLVI